MSIIRSHGRRAPLGGMAGALRRRAALAVEGAVKSGLPPRWGGWRWIREETLRAYFARGGLGDYECIHQARRETNPLPRNVAELSALSDDPDWFGFSMRDVPIRSSGETVRVTVPDCTIVSFTDPERGRFWPTIINRDERAFELREMRFRPGHGAVLRQSVKPHRLARATWITERVYDNHSHWLTAHLPKLCLLKARGELDDLVLPARRTPVIEESLRLLGIDPRDFRTHEPGQPLRVDTLRLLGTDRFRPELLCLVREAMGRPSDRAPWRKVFISRTGARIRRLTNEAEIEPILARAGFDIVVMESLGLEEQIRLMGETRVLLAPHGAGLTNMMFCTAGAHIIELAEPAYPNPNFYALACAMDLNYWHVPARFSGDPTLTRLDRDLSVDPLAVAAVLKKIDGWSGCGSRSSFRFTMARPSSRRRYVRS